MPPRTHEHFYTSLSRYDEETGMITARCECGAETDLAALAAQRRKVEVSRRGQDIDYAVYPPEGIEDPYEGDHMAWDWNEVLEMVEEYEKLVGKTEPEIT